MDISKLFKKKKCVYSFELFPPQKTASIKTIYDTLGQVVELQPDYVSITYGAGGDGGTETAELVKAVKKAGIEPMPHITCIGNTKKQVLSLIDKFQDAGASNIMALRGDIPEGAKVRDFRYASDLAEFLRKERPKLNIAGACYPEGHNEAVSKFADIKNLKKKINAGVTHLNSQLFFDNEDFFEFCDLIDLAGIEVPVQAGIMPIVKLNQVNRVISMTGVKIPSKLSRLLSRYGQDENALMDAGIAYATEQISDLIAGGVRGIHLYIMNNVYVATRITENIKSLLQRANEQK